jgi:hypothetical protein
MQNENVLLKWYYRQVLFFKGHHVVKRLILTLLGLISRHMYTLLIYKLRKSKGLTEYTYEQYSQNVFKTIIERNLLISMLTLNYTCHFVHRNLFYRFVYY